VKRLALVLVGVLAACATRVPPPETQMTAARAMVAQARLVAQQDAPQELASAQAKLARAERAMQRRNYEEARLLAEQAEADARLAWTASQLTQAQRAVAAERPSR